jgi:hypothetical protein
MAVLLATAVRPEITGAYTGVSGTHRHAACMFSPTAHSTGNLPAVTGGSRDL